MEQNNAASCKRWKDKNQSRYLLSSAKYRARKLGLSFDLTETDLTIPTHCPVLGIPLMRQGSKNRNNAPSVDRWNNSLGYVKGNVRVISQKANRLKSDATIGELEAVLKYMLSISKSQTVLVGKVTCV